MLLFFLDNLNTLNILLFQTALSIFFQDSSVSSCNQNSAQFGFGQVSYFNWKVKTAFKYLYYFFQMTPCNTPATPPNFPDTLIAFSRMTTSSENSKLGSSPSEFNSKEMSQSTVYYVFDKNFNLIINFYLIK